MASTIYLTLLAAVILGTDLTISDAEFLQQISTTTSAAFDSHSIAPNLALPTTIPQPMNNSSIKVNHLNVTTASSSSSSSSTTIVTISKISENYSTLYTTYLPIITTIPATEEPPTTPVSFTVTTLESNTITSTTANSSVVENAIPEPPSSDSLTKGFSIPTFLPDFPALSSNTADVVLPGVPPAASSPLTPEEMQQQQDQLYLAAYNKHHAPKKNLTIQESNVTVQVGSHAYMPCHIRRLMNKPVSWVRVRDGHILTVDQTTFIADQRFQSIFKGENEYTWSLQIKYIQDTDEGWYECQVSTEPKMSAKVYLSVVVPVTELIGDQNRFVKAGSKVALHCIVRGTLEPPTYIIWFRGKTQVMDDNKMGWYTQIDRNIFGNSSDQQNTIGSLIIPFVRKKDSGNYTCQPSNSATVSVDLHVLSGEYSASAIMSAAATYNKHNSCYIFLILLLAALHRT